MDEEAKKNFQEQKKQELNKHKESNITSEVSLKKRKTNLNN